MGPSMREMNQEMTLRWMPVIFRLIRYGELDRYNSVVVRLSVWTLANATK